MKGLWIVSLDVLFNLVHLIWKLQDLQILKLKKSKRVTEFCKMK